MILPLASTIQNSLQDLTSRICGIDTNAQATQAFALGGAAGGAIGYGISAIKEQFKTPRGDINNSPNAVASYMQGNDNQTQGNFVSRIKNFVNPQMSLSSEKDYNGNINPIRDVITNENKINNTEGQANTSIGNKIGNTLKTGAKATGAYLSLGRRMVEGDANVSFEKKVNEPRKQMQHSEYINNLKEIQYKENLGDDNEYKG